MCNVYISCRLQGKGKHRNLYCTALQGQETGCCTPFCLHLNVFLQTPPRDAKYWTSPWSENVLLKVEKKKKQKYTQRSKQNSQTNVHWKVNLVLCVL